jgi:tRNA(Ile)-lysidine synthase
MDSLTLFWLSNRQYWFNSTPETDEKVLEHTQKYFDQPHLVEYLNDLGKIIFYDQIYRHYVRYNKLDKSIIEEKNKQSIEITNLLLNSGIINSFAPIERCFARMPLRHSSDENDRIKAINIIETYMEQYKSSDYIRFYQASLERVRNPTLLVNQETENESYFPQELVCESSVFNINDFPTNFYNLITQQEIPSKFVEGFNVIPKDQQITISISGGSDSMLCLFIAYKLGYNVIAMMIDYCNRSEHEKEIKFVKWFCHQLNVPFYVRKISELKRNRDGTREFYELVTRNIRFNSYKYLERPVVLGHNLDDCFENCITNIMTQRSKDNLYGMSKESEQYGVKIYRPILTIPKKVIVETCNTFKIPFLLDSTPKWSRRGQIRDIVVPALNQFDTNLIPRIMEFCHNSSESLKDYQKLLETFPIHQSTNKKGHLEFQFPISKPFDTNPRFWQGMINRITDMAKIQRVRVSTIQSMINNIHRDIDTWDHQVIKISLTLNLVTFVNLDTNQIIFRVV